MNSKRLRNLFAILMLGLPWVSTAWSAIELSSGPVLGVYPQLPAGLARLDQGALEQRAEQGDNEAAMELAKRLLKNGTSEYFRAQGIIEKAAQRGYAPAQFIMGYMLATENASSARNMGGDLESVRDWYEKAALQNHIQAARELGDMYVIGYIPRDYPEAIRWLTLAAEAGDVGAMASLALVYSNPNPYVADHVPDLATSAIWYLKAARAGDTDCRFTYALLQARGLGVKKNKLAALATMVIAAQEGEPVAQLVVAGLLDLELLNERRLSWKAKLPGEFAPLDLSKLTLDRLLKNVDSIRDATRQYSNFETHFLSGRLQELTAKTSKDFENAMASYATSKVGYNEGHLTPYEKEAYRGIFRILRNPKYTSRPRNLGNLLPEKSLNLYHPELRFELAELWWQGSASVPVNRTNAVYWYLEAARLDSAPAMVRLGDLWYEGASGRVDKPEAVRWWQRAAFRDHAPAQTKLGRVLLSEMGDKISGHAWLQVAVKNNDSDAIEELKRAGTDLTAEEQSQVAKKVAELSARITRSATVGKK